MESSLLFDDFVPSTHPAAAYIGGKRRLAKPITRAIDRTPHQTYAETFVGMGGVFLRRRRKAPAEVINDWSEDVATFFRVLQRHHGAFLDQLRLHLTMRAAFDRFMLTDPVTLTDIERAVRFFYLQRTAFGGKVAGRTFGVSPGVPGAIDVRKIDGLIRSIHRRLSGVMIERLNWLDFIVRYDRAGTLFYLDPPYYGSEGDYGRELFDRGQFPLMAEALRELVGTFLLSINDHPEVRRIFDGFAMVEQQLIYSIAGGGHQTDARELIISNLPAERLAELFF
ncbi:DNA adenine methylase [Sphingomonadaceae bacterium G21617-S1]|nr:DNA adenine methylase [Sphingomonadaceae bacterium G21617-S1]